MQLGIQEFVLCTITDICFWNFKNIFSDQSFKLLFSEQLLRRTSISPVLQGAAPTLLKVVDPNSIAQVTQGVSMVSTTDTTEGITQQVIKMEPQAPEQTQNETVKEKHPMHAMTSVMKNTAKGKR